MVIIRIVLTITQKIFTALSRLSTIHLCGGIFSAEFIISFTAMTHMNWVCIVTQSSVIRCWNFMYISYISSCSAAES